MNARVYIGLKLLFANEVGSQEPVSSKNLQDKNIPKPANPAKKRNHASIHIYSNMLPKLRPEKSAIYIHISHKLKLDHFWLNTNGFYCKVI